MSCGVTWLGLPALGGHRCLAWSDDAAVCGVHGMSNLGVEEKRLVVPIPELPCVLCLTCSCIPMEACICRIRLGQHRGVSLGSGVHQKARDGIGWSQRWAGEYPPTMRAVSSAFGCGGALSERASGWPPVPSLHCMRKLENQWCEREKAQRRGQPSETPSSRGGGRLSNLGGFVARWCDPETCRGLVLALDSDHT